MTDAFMTQAMEQMEGMEALANQAAEDAQRED